MRSQLHGVVAAASLVGALSLISVQSAAVELSFRVPFAFMVNEKTLTPGTYKLSIERNVVLVRGLRDGAMVLTVTVQSSEPSDAKLVFHRYGERYILKEAWTGSLDGRAVPESPRERELKLGSDGLSAVELQRVTIPAL